MKRWSWLRQPQSSRTAGAAQDDLRGYLRWGGGADHGGWEDGAAGYQLLPVTGGVRRGRRETAVRESWGRAGGAAAGPGLGSAKAQPRRRCPRRRPAGPRGLFSSADGRARRPVGADAAESPAAALLHAVASPPTWPTPLLRSPLGAQWGRGEPGPEPARGMPARLHPSAGAGNHPANPAPAPAEPAPAVPLGCRGGAEPPRRAPTPSAAWPPRARTAAAGPGGGRWAGVGLRAGTPRRGSAPCRGFPLNGVRRGQTT